MYLEENLKMPKKGTNPARKAWNILRIALLWARKGGVFRNKVAISLSLLRKGVKTLRHHNAAGSGALIYGERELSFDETPIIHVKMHRLSSLRFKMPHIPCINPHVDFDYDFELNDESQNKIHYYNNAPRKSFLTDREEEDDEEAEFERVCEEIYGPPDEGIDLKAEEFIARFYKQMKMQRQISFIQYNESLNRGSG